ncbi:hypothetical protein HDU99_001198, partial [Rhizoclosmatium hyalinum]
MLTFSSPFAAPSIHDAVKDGNVELVNKLARQLGHGQVDVRDDDGWTPLHLAANNGCSEAVAILLSCGADANAGDKWKKTPLHLARTHSVIRLLLDNGANVNALNSFGCSPLHHAVLWRHSDIELARLLLEKGAIVDQMGDGESPLFIASKDNQLEHARLLISFKAHVNVVCEGKSPLSIAAEFGHLGIVKLLVENRANVNQFEYTQSPLYLAIQNNHVDVAKFLIQQNAYVSLTDPRMKSLATKLGGQTCYELGKYCVTENEMMAAYWFSFAAELGYAAAWSPLASMLLKGRGITRSLVNAES